MNADARRLVLESDWRCVEHLRRLAPAGTWTMATWTRGFGSARVESLTVDGRGDATKLNGDTNIGDGLRTTSLSSSPRLPARSRQIHRVLVHREHVQRNDDCLTCTR